MDTTCDPPTPTGAPPSGDYYILTESRGSLGNSLGPSDLRFLISKLLLLVGLIRHSPEITTSQEFELQQSLSIVFLL